MAYKKANVAITIDHSRPMDANSSDLSASSSALSTAVADTLPTDVCYALHVTGAHPALARVLRRNMPPASASCPLPPPQLGLVSGTYNVGESASFEVPIGNDRRFDLIGFSKADLGGSCPRDFHIEARPRTDHPDDPSIVMMQGSAELPGTLVGKIYANGVASVLPGENNISLKLVYDATTNTVGADYTGGSCENGGSNGTVPVTGGPVVSPDPTPAPQMFVFPYVGPSAVANGPNLMRVGMNPMFLQMGCNIPGTASVKVVNTTLGVSYLQPCSNGVAMIHGITISSTASETSPDLLDATALDPNNAVIGTLSFGVALSPRYYSLGTHGTFSDSVPLSITHPSASDEVKFSGIGTSAAGFRILYLTAIDPSVSPGSILYAIPLVVPTAVNPGHPFDYDPNAYINSSSGMISTNLISSTGGTFARYFDVGNALLIFKDFSNVTLPGDLTASVANSTSIHNASMSHYLDFQSDVDFGVAVGQGAPQLATSFAALPPSWSSLVTTSPFGGAMQHVAVTAPAVSAVPVKSVSYVAYASETSTFPGVALHRCLNRTTCNTSTDGDWDGLTDTASFSSIAKPLAVEFDSTGPLPRLFAASPAKFLIYSNLGAPGQVRSYGSGLVPTAGVQLNPTGAPGSGGFFPSWSSPDVRFIKVLGKIGSLDPTNASDIIVGGSAYVDLATKAVIYRSRDGGLNFYRVFVGASNTKATDATSILRSYYDPKTLSFQDSPGFAVAVKFGGSTPTTKIFWQESHGY